MKNIQPPPSLPFANSAMTGTPTINGLPMLQWLNVTGLNAVTGANAVIGTTLAGKTFLPLFAFIQATAQSGTITVVPIISIGTNSTAFNNIIPAITCTGLTAANLLVPFPIVAVAASVASATAITAKFNTVASGAGAALTVSIYLGGIYI